MDQLKTTKCNKSMFSPFETDGAFQTSGIDPRGEFSRRIRCWCRNNANPSSGLSTIKKNEAIQINVLLICFSLALVCCFSLGSIFLTSYRNLCCCCFVVVTVCCSMLLLLLSFAVCLLCGLLYFAVYCSLLLYVALCCFMLLYVALCRFIFSLTTYRALCGCLLL